MKYSRIISIILPLLILGFLAWYFSNIVTYFVVAMVLTMIGQPIVTLLERIHIGRFRLPHSLNCIIAVLVIVVVFSSFIGFFVPLVSNQATLISKIDLNTLNDNLQEKVTWLERQMTNAGILGKDQNLVAIINQNVESILKLDRIGSYFNNLLSFAGSFFMGVFSILFITFYMLKESRMVLEWTLLIVPTRFHTETKNVFSNTGRLLTRYFVGVSLEVMAMIILLSLGLSLLGVKNAVLIGFIGGFFNIIPYLGPLIGGTIGVILGVTNVLSTGGYDQILPVTLSIVGTFVGANLIDNLVLQPFIYSSSVKAHPLEIFVVLLMGGSIAGVVGMVLAIPTYTVLRVVAKEFMGHFRIVQKLTENI